MTATRPALRRVRLLFSFLCLMMGLSMFLAAPGTFAQSYQKAVWIPVDNTIERGLESFLRELSRTRRSSRQTLSSCILIRQVAKWMLPTRLGSSSANLPCIPLPTLTIKLFQRVPTSL